MFAFSFNLTTFFVIRWMCKFDCLRDTLATFSFSAEEFVQITRILISHQNLFCTSFTICTRSTILLESECFYSIIWTCQILCKFVFSEASSKSNLNIFPITSSLFQNDIISSTKCNSIWTTINLFVTWCAISSLMTCVSLLLSAINTFTLCVHKWIGWAS